MNKRERMNDLNLFDGEKHSFICPYCRGKLDIYRGERGLRNSGYMHLVENTDVEDYCELCGEDIVWVIAVMKKDQVP